MILLVQEVFGENMCGWNLHGETSYSNTAESKRLNAKIAELENLQKPKKRKQKPNFDFLLENVKEGNRVWDW